MFGHALLPLLMILYQLDLYLLYQLDNRRTCYRTQQRKLQKEHNTHTRTHGEAHPPGSTNARAPPTLPTYSPYTTAIPHYNAHISCPLSHLQHHSNTQQLQRPLATHVRGRFSATTTNTPYTLYKNKVNREQYTCKHITIHDEYQHTHTAAHFTLKHNKHTQRTAAQRRHGKRKKANTISQTKVNTVWAGGRVAESP